MSLSEVLDIILKIALILMVLGFFAVTVVLLQTMFLVKNTIRELDEEVRPAVKKVTEMVETETIRVDEMVKVVQDISTKVQATSQIIQEIIASPLIRAAGFAAGTRRAVDTLFGRKGR